MEKWEGLVAVVTGASAGIGEAIAIILAEHGMKVAALARREDRLKTLAEKFRGKGTIKGYKCDVSKGAEIEQTFREIVKDLGKVRVLVNNAGIATNSKLTDFCMDKWKQMFDVNVFGMFTCIKQVVHAAVQSNEKNLIHIINVNSIVGHQPNIDIVGPIYPVTKHCVTLLTRSLLKEMALENLKNIRITSLSPGVVDTEIFDVGGWGKSYINDIAYLPPEDIAKGVLAVLSVPDHVVISEITIKPAGEVI